jgi:hypothetical protein
MGLKALHPFAQIESSSRSTKNYSGRVYFYRRGLIRNSSRRFL